MSQSAKIFLAVFVGYFIFTTTKGNLGRWLDILGLKASA